MTNFPPRVFSLDYLTINIREIRSAETSEIHKKQSITSQKTRASFTGSVAGGIFMSWVWQTCTICRIYKHGCTDVLVVDDRLSSI